jgi:hypothetical protein
MGRRNKMLIVYPKKHQFVPDEPPTISTTSDPTPRPMVDLTPCKSCGLLERVGCHRV